MTVRFISRQLGGARAILLASGLMGVVASTLPAAAGPFYPWRANGAQSQETLAKRIAPLRRFERIPAADGSVCRVPARASAKACRRAGLTYTGKLKWRQDVHVAVIDIDVGKRDLQQCADAIMRLRGEWLYGAGRTSAIAFNDTDGKRRAFSRQTRQDYPAFRKYMDLVFAYAGTYSLDRELKPVAISDIAIGDVFIKSGFPGHAVLVADMAADKATGEKRFLLIFRATCRRRRCTFSSRRNPIDGGLGTRPRTSASSWSRRNGFSSRTALKRWPDGPSLSRSGRARRESVVARTR